MNGFMKMMIPTTTLLLTILLRLTTAAANTHFGFQSGYQFKNSNGAVDGYSYGSSLHYDKANNLLYVTGGTYWSYWDNAGQVLSDASRAKYMKHSDCFIGVFKVPMKTERQSNNVPQVMFADRFGVESVHETCSAITLMNGVSGDGNGMVNVVMAGHTEENGFLTSLRPFGSPKSTMYGFLLNMNFKLDKNDKRVASVKRNSDGGMLFNDETTQYPVAVTSNPNDTSSNEVYIVTLASRSKTSNDYSQLSKPDLTAAGGVEEPPYGTNFDIVLQKIVQKDADEISYELKEAQYHDGSEEQEAGVDDTLKSGWTQVFSLTNPEYSSSSRMLKTTDGSGSLRTFVRVADLKYVPYTNNEGKDDHLILAGTTNGYGAAFGRTVGGANVHVPHHGFVTKLSTEGDIVATQSIHINGKFVSIKGICFDTSNGNGVDLFVVGDTNGKLDESMTSHDVSASSSGRFGKHAFLTKLDFSTLDIIWSRQIGGKGGLDVTGYGCAVNKSDKRVYMTGTVKSGGDLHVLQKDINDSDGRVHAESAGGDDIFVANFNMDNGKTIFMKQMGTSQHDSIAKGNGIVVDKNGDAIIMGNTKGSMMRWRGDGALAADGDPYDVFIMSVSKDGETRVISEVSKSNGSGGGGDGEDDSIPGSGDGVDSQGALEGFEIFAIIVASVILFVTVLYVGYARIGFERSSGINNSERIINYVRDFDDNDVRLHVRHSATGGVHGIYSPIKSRKTFLEEDLLDSELSTEKFSTPKSNKRVSFKDDNTTNAVLSSQESLNLQVTSSNSLSPSQQSLDAQRNLLDALDSVEADYKTNKRTTPTQSTSPRYTTSTPVFDGGLIRMSRTEQTNQNMGMGNDHRVSTPAPPTHAFHHTNEDNDDDDDDDDWKTEIL